ncbi:MAG: UPF0175 family protein [Desulfovermiculus sp.]|nr:UPF0175 family protein [Desulfovermiculus sp.]
MVIIELPDLNMPEDELKMLLAQSLLQQGAISLGKAAEIAGHSERTFVEILLKKGISPIHYDEAHLEDELRNA